MTKSRKVCSLLAAIATAWSSTQAQDHRPLALTNARILTMSDAGVIERGTVLVRDGRIEAVGADVKTPLGARVIDVKGGTVMPGYVHAWSTAGLGGARPMPMPSPQQGRRGGRGRGGAGEAPPAAQSGGNQAAARVADGLYAKQDVFADLLREGVTGLFLHPAGTGFPGRAARIEPDGKSLEDLVANPEAYHVLMPTTNTGGKKLVKGEFEKARKVVEERKKPKPEPKPAEPAKPAGGEAKPADAKPPADGGKPADPPKDPPKPEGEKPAAEKKPEPSQPAPQKPPEPKKDPNVEVLADLLEGKGRCFLRLSTAMEVQHWLDANKDLKLETVVVADSVVPTRGRLDESIDHLKQVTKAVLVPPSLAEIPFTRTLVNTPKRLLDAGLEVGFVLPDDPARLRDLRFALMELVRAGLPADAALRGVTAVPAKLLGVDQEMGSIAKGRRADLLVFSGDPLDPSSVMQHVLIRGHEVAEEVSR
jgi:hypothetical protein